MENEFDGIIKLAYAIVTACCEDYREAYINGNSNELTKCKSFLLSGEVEIFTSYTFYGKEIVATMDAELKKKYGTFEERRKKKAELFKLKIENKKRQLEIVRNEIKDIMHDESLSSDYRESMLVTLRNRRYRLIGEINRLKKEAKE